MNRCLIACFALFLFAGCNNVLRYHYKKHYSEKNRFRSEPTQFLNQRVFYDYPSVHDEEFFYYLELTFTDTAAAYAKKTLDLETDTLIVRARYGVFSIWNWDEEHNRVTGTIEVVSHDSTQITLKERVKIYDDRRDATVVFKGKRRFEWSKDAW